MQENEKGHEWIIVEKLVVFSLPLLPVQSFAVHPLHVTVIDVNTCEDPQTQVREKCA